jgi:hypothetical protein
MTANGGPHPERCILVTGGAGYIGSHTSLQLLLDGYKVVIIDNFANSCEEAVRRVLDLAGKQGQNLVLHKVGNFDFSYYVLHYSCYYSWSLVVKWCIKCSLPARLRLSESRHYCDKQNELCPANCQWVKIAFTFCRRICRDMRILAVYLWEEILHELLIQFCVLALIFEHLVNQWQTWTKIKVDDWLRPQWTSVSWDVSAFNPSRSILSFQNLCQHFHGMYAASVACVEISSKP